jgi:hypothetical protein
MVGGLWSTLRLFDVFWFFRHLRRNALTLRLFDVKFQVDSLHACVDFPTLHQHGIIDEDSEGAGKGKAQGAAGGPKGSMVGCWIDRDLLGGLGFRVWGLGCIASGAWGSSFRV